ncbi:hypothetical protein N7510_003980 [Penicillium lagena]|uniref:uncharacterized protein n=1 Tax=Penicillium lagena TaxID=94218 RepID=UPI00253F7FA9|nr:uncharacterized protein N7510_003980 [Penicillium lagena]KAJ5619996.1 hypothetical protein N7510_003980 [Penicillium lagena]
MSPAGPGTTAHDDPRIPVFYLAGYILLSYVISAMGCATTVELLHRRTSRAGFYNWYVLTLAKIDHPITLFNSRYLLLTSSVTMGGIGIWCMHFIGNRAVVLGDGSPEIQILYNVAFTGTSFVLPVVVLLIAFYAIGGEEKAGYIRILAGGLLTGSSVCGMHYVGQLGIANYKCSYRVANVVGSAIIAIFSSTTALGIFFRWRASWTDSWWRRGICAFLLAGAVSGMHWTAAAGTSYRERDESLKHGTQLSRGQVVIICSVLACVSCVILSACAIVAGGNRRRSTNRAHQLVLACAYFDPAGRVMVTPQALLPSRKIVDHYIGRTFKDDDLTRTHPTFLWAFRASRNWTTIKELVPLMQTRLESEGRAIQKHVLSRGVVLDKETELQTDFDTLFKQLFCVTAQDLSTELRVPLQDLGMLYDDVLTTAIPVSRISRAMGRSSLRTGKGQLMFSVRQLQKYDATRLASLGFRFATIEHVTSMLSRRIHVPESSLLHNLRDMRDYASSKRGFGEGVHLTSFIMRPTIHDHFEVLTAKGTGNPLPSATLPMKQLQVQHLELLSHMEGWSMSHCLKYLESENLDLSMASFRDHLVGAITSLSKCLPEDIASAARLSSRPLTAPCNTLTLPAEDRIQHRCTLLAFCVVGSLNTQISNPDFTFTPLRLFRVQQQANDDATDRDAFIRELGQELFFTDIRSASSATESDVVPPSTRSGIHRFWPSRSKKTVSMSATPSSQVSLVEPMTSPLRDITVQKEVRVDVTQLHEPPTPTSIGTHDSRTIIAAAASPSSYVDELYGLCYARGIRLQPDSTFQRQVSLKLGV